MKGEAGDAGTAGLPGLPGAVGDAGMYNIIFSLCLLLYTDPLSVLGFGVSSSTHKSDIVFYRDQIGLTRSSWPTWYTR